MVKGQRDSVDPSKMQIESTARLSESSDSSETNQKSKECKVIWKNPKRPQVAAPQDFGGGCPSDPKITSSSVSQRCTLRWLGRPSLEAQSLEQWGHWKSVVVTAAAGVLWR